MTTTTPTLPGTDATETPRFDAEREQAIATRFARRTGGRPSGRSLVLLSGSTRVNGLLLDAKRSLGGRDADAIGKARGDETSHANREPAEGGN